MSYSIIYGAQFIKGTNNGTEVFFPIVLIGDNNCYEVTRSGRKRSRDFRNLTYYVGGKFFGTKETILQGVENSRISCIESNKSYLLNNPDWDNYSDASYGWFASIAMAGKHTAQTSFQTFKNVFSNGIKHALTVEELIAVNVQPKIYTSHYANKKLKEVGLEPLDLKPKTTAQLFQMLESANIYKTNGIDVYLDFRGDEETLKRIKQTYYPATKKVNKEPKKVTEYHSILFDNGYYFNKLTSRHLQFNYSKEVSKKFTTKAQAQKVVDKLNGRFSTKVVEIQTTQLETAILI